VKRWEKIRFVLLAVVVCVLFGCNDSRTMKQDDWIARTYDPDYNVVCYRYYTYGISCVICVRLEKAP